MADVTGTDHLVRHEKENKLKGYDNEAFHPEDRAEEDESASDDDRLRVVVTENGHRPEDDTPLPNGYGHEDSDDHSSSTATANGVAVAVVGEQKENSSNDKDIKDSSTTMASHGKPPDTKLHHYVPIEDIDRKILNGSDTTRVNVPEDAVISFSTGRVRMRKGASNSPRLDGDRESIPLETILPTYETEEKTALSEKAAELEAELTNHKNGLWSDGSTYGVGDVPLGKSEKLNGKSNSGSDVSLPVNSHRKCLRGEKLYFTEDNRKLCPGWRRILVCGLILIIVAVALLLGVLAATGILLAESESKNTKYESGQSLPSMDSVSHAGHSFRPRPPPKVPQKFQPPVTEEQRPNATSEAEEGAYDTVSLTPPTVTSKVPVLNDTSYSQTIVPNALVGEFTITDENFTEDLKDNTSAGYLSLSTHLETELQRIFRRNGGEFSELKILKFSPGSIKVKFVVMWKSDHRIISATEALDIFVSYLMQKNNLLLAFPVDTSSLKFTDVYDECRIQKGGCSYDCVWNYDTLSKNCICPNNMSLTSDKKTCGPITTSSPSPVTTPKFIYGTSTQSLLITTSLESAQTTASQSDKDDVTTPYPVTEISSEESSTIPIASKDSSSTSSETLLTTDVSIVTEPTLIENFTSVFISTVIDGFKEDENETTSEESTTVPYDVTFEDAGKETYVTNISDEVDKNTDSFSILTETMEESLTPTTASHDISLPLPDSDSTSEDLYTEIEESVTSTPVFLNASENVSNISEGTSDNVSDDSVGIVTTQLFTEPISPDDFKTGMTTEVPNYKDTIVTEISTFDNVTVELSESQSSSVEFMENNNTSPEGTYKKDLIETEITALDYNATENVYAETTVAPDLSNITHPSRTPGVRSFDNFTSFTDGDASEDLNTTPNPLLTSDEQYLDVTNKSIIDDSELIPGLNESSLTEPTIIDKPNVVTELLEVSNSSLNLEDENITETTEINEYMANNNTEITLTDEITTYDNKTTTSYFNETSDNVDVSTETESEIAYNTRDGDTTLAIVTEGLFNITGEEIFILNTMEVSNETTVPPINLENVTDIEYATVSSDLVTSPSVTNTTDIYNTELMPPPTVYENETDIEIATTPATNVDRDSLEITVPAFEMNTSSTDLQNSTLEILDNITSVTTMQNDNTTILSNESVLNDTYDTTNIPFTDIFENDTFTTEEISTTEIPSFSGNGSIGLDSNTSLQENTTVTDEMIFQDNMTAISSKEMNETFHDNVTNINNTNDTTLITDEYEFNETTALDNITGIITESDWDISHNESESVLNSTTAAEIESTYSVTDNITGIPEEFDSEIWNVTEGGNGTSTTIYEGVDSNLTDTKNISSSNPAPAFGITIISDDNITYVDYGNYTTDVYEELVETATNASVGIECSEDQFLCDPLNKCINNTFMCDGIEDCPDGVDEFECKDTCHTNFMCTNSSMCIMSEARCDGIWDCENGTDEENCTPTECAQHEVMCLDGSKCIKPGHICDWKYNCKDRSDEVGCVERTTCESGGRFFCNDGLCIPWSLKCDGEYDCKDKEDEANCTCLSDEFQCNDGKCLKTSSRCDGHQDCHDAGDEMGCVNVDSQHIVTTFEPYSNTWALLCAEDWTLDDGQYLCQELGFGHALKAEKVHVSFNGTWMSMRRDNLTEMSLWTERVAFVESCTSSLAASVECQKFACGEYTGLLHRRKRDVIGTASQWPFIGYASTFKSNKGCLSEILTPIWLITSAECLLSISKEPFNGSDWYVRTNIGRNIEHDLAQNHEVLKIVLHHHSSKFRSLALRDYDVALIRLKHALVFVSDKIGAICPPEEQVPPGITCFSGGLGTEKPRAPPPEIITINSLALQILDKRNCNRIEHYNEHVNQRMLCTQSSEGHTICDNDEGTPLMCLTGINKWFLAGMLTYQRFCDVYSKHPAVFSNLFSMRKFLDQVTGQKQYEIPYDSSVYIIIPPTTPSPTLPETTTMLTTTSLMETTTEMMMLDMAVTVTENITDIWDNVTTIPFLDEIGREESYTDGDEGIELRTSSVFNISDEGEMMNDTYDSNITSIITEVTELSAEKSLEGDSYNATEWPGLPVMGPSNETSGEFEGIYNISDGFNGTDVENVTDVLVLSPPPNTTEMPFSDSSVMLEYEISNTTSIINTSNSDLQFINKTDENTFSETDVENVTSVMNFDEDVLLLPNSTDVFDLDNQTETSITSVFSIDIDATTLSAEEAENATGEYTSETNVTDPVILFNETDALRLSATLENVGHNVTKEYILRSRNIDEDTSFNVSESYEDSSGNFSMLPNDATQNMPLKLENSTDEISVPLSTTESFILIENVSNMPENTSADTFVITNATVNFEPNTDNETMIFENSTIYEDLFFNGTSVFGIELNENSTVDPASVTTTHLSSDKIIVLESENHTFSGLEECGSWNSNTTIYDANGTNFFEQWPALGFLQTVNESKMCASSILSSHFVITSLNCLFLRDNYLNPENWTYVSGFYNMSTPGMQSYLISKIIPYSIENTTSVAMASDIALVKVKEEITLNPYSKSVCLPYEDILPEQVCFSVGWSNRPTEDGGEKDFYSIPVTIISSEECNSTVDSDELVLDSMICTKQNNDSMKTCELDLGSPLFCYKNNLWELQGILHSSGVCDENQHSVYSKITNIQPWIANLLQSDKQ